MKIIRRKTTFFEKILLLIGLFIGGIGFFALNTIYRNSGGIINYELLGTVFVWAILLFLIILAATAENQREEQTIISKEVHQETTLMKELIKDQVTEIKLLRQDLAELKNIEKILKKRK